MQNLSEAETKIHHPIYNPQNCVCFICNNFLRTLKRSDRYHPQEIAPNPPRNIFCSQKTAASKLFGQLWAWSSKTAQRHPKKLYSTVGEVESRGGGVFPWCKPFNQKWRCSLMFAKASIYVYVYIYIYLEPKWGPLFWLEFRPCFGGLTFKNRGQLGSRYIYIYIVWNVTVIRHPFLRTDLQSFIDSSLHIQCPTQFLSTKCCIWRSVQGVSSMSALQRCPRTGKALKER